MSSARVIGLFFLLSLLGWLALSTHGQARQDGPPERAQAQQLVERFQRNALNNIKQVLGCTDDEFKVLEPKISHIMLLQYEQSAGFSPFSRRRGMAGALASALPPSEVQKARLALRDLVDEKDAKPSDIAEKLRALREVRAAARTELTGAQDDLRQFLTVRQEAALVAMGLLD
jgi:hypothetical protein